MSLASGTRVGPYEIVNLLGVGGMGEVYRARDTNLGRDVALKTLPASLTHDPERLARFRREAQVLAALNHPQIAGIYGFEEASGQRVLVLELVEGETLADRIKRGPLPVEDALNIAREIAEALEAAHGRGIIHRDLKPANIALTGHDRVKVLDFGLAKATDPLASTGGVDPLNSPTITSPAALTGLGVILGTAAYMSPEQARGRVADKRSDVWAFGCVLYEMLTGKRAFQGDDVSDTLASVIKTDPAWEALPASIPPAVRALLEGCLAKNHRDRISDISTAIFLLKDAKFAAARPQTTAPRAAAPSAASRALWALFLLAAAAAGALATNALRPASTTPDAPVVRFEIAVPEGRQFTLARAVLAVSPDGSRLVYAADGRLYVRVLSEIDSIPIPGADPAVHPAFSPDGASLVYWTDAALKRISASGGVPVPVCETTPAPLGIHWSESGIVFGQLGKGIMRVSPNGGTPDLVVPVAPSEGVAHGPQVLPGGDLILFTLAKTDSAFSTVWGKTHVMVQSIKTGQRAILVEGGSDGRYVPTGHLIYMVDGTLMAVRFDPLTLKVTPGAVPMVQGIRRAAASAGGATHLGFSQTGVIAYLPGPSRAGEEDLFLYDRKGVTTPLRLPRSVYAFPRVSPNGRQIAFETSDGKNAVISIYDLSGTSSARRITFGGNNHLPIWSADGKRIAFQSDREGDRAIFWQSVDGGPAERLTRPEKGTAHVPESWLPLPAGDTFLFHAQRDGEFSAFMFSLKDRKATPLNDVAPGPFPPNATFSPNGKWVAYQSGDKGAVEPFTYVQPFPSNGTKFQVAAGGRPMWSRDGKELFLVPGPGKFVAVSVRYEPSFTVTTPYEVPRRFGLAPPASPRPYDILPDGRIISADTAQTPGDPRGPQIHVVLNWFEELKKKVPVGK